VGNILFHLQFPAPTEVPQLKLESFFESLDGWEVLTFGSGTVTLDNLHIVLSSQNTINSGGGILQRFDEVPIPLTWSKKRSFKLKAKVAHGNDANPQQYICMGYEGTNRRAFGFRFINDKVQGFAQNGGAKATVDLITGLGNTYLRDEIYEAIFTPGSKVEFYINEVLKGTLTTNLPTGTTDSDWMMRLMIYSGAAVLHEIYTSYIKAIQET